jgi:hypothetical protein
VIEIKCRPMKTRAIANDLHLSNLLFRGLPQTLQILTGDYNPVTIAQFENQQIQSRSGLVFHCHHTRFVLQQMCLFYRPVDFSICGDDPMLCHEFLPTMPPDHRNVQQRYLGFSLRQTSLHWTAESHPCGQPARHCRRIANLRSLRFRSENHAHGAADDRWNRR